MWIKSFWRLSIHTWSFLESVSFSCLSRETSVLCDILSHESSVAKLIALASLLSFCLAIKFSCSWSVLHFSHSAGGGGGGF